MNPMFAPLMAESMAGLPPTVLYASRNEVLLDDSIFYHRRLQEDGVEVGKTMSNKTLTGYLLEDSIHKKVTRETFHYD